MSIDSINPSLAKGLTNTSGNLEMEGCSFQGNTAEKAGGAIFFGQGNLQIQKTDGNGVEGVQDVTEAVERDLVLDDAVGLAFKKAYPDPPVPELRLPGQEG